MLYYIVVYHTRRNERARIVMRAQTEENARGLIMEAFGNEWHIDKVIRVDNVTHMLEL